MCKDKKFEETLAGLEEAENKLEKELDNIQDGGVNQNQYSKALNGNSDSQVNQNDNKYSNVNGEIIYDEVRISYFGETNDSPKKKVEWCYICGLVYVIIIGLLTVFHFKATLLFAIEQLITAILLILLAIWGMGGNKYRNKTAYMLPGMSIVWLTLMLNYFLSKCSEHCKRIAQFLMVEFEYKLSFKWYKLTCLLIFLLLIMFFIEFWNELYKEKNKEKMSKSIDEILNQYVKKDEDKKNAIDMLLDSSNNLSTGLEKELKNSIVIKFFQLSNVALIAFFTTIGFIFRNLIKPIEVESTNITSTAVNFFSTVNAGIIKQVFFYITVGCIIILYIFDVFFGLYKYSRRFLELYKEVLRDKKFTLLFGRKTNSEDLNE